MKSPKQKTMIRVVSLVVLFAVAIGFSMRQREMHKRTCANNLNQIYSATLSLALEGALYRGDTIPESKIAEILVGDRIPVCPSGGHYSIPPIGQHPVCSFHGDPFAAGGIFSGPPTAKELAIRERPAK
jgi:hypothetical protein